MNIARALEADAEMGATSLPRERFAEACTYACIGAGIHSRDVGVDELVAAATWLFDARLNARLDTHGRVVASARDAISLLRLGFAGAYSPTPSAGKAQAIARLGPASPDQRKARPAGQAHLR